MIPQVMWQMKLEAEDTEESRARIENIDELISKTVAYQEAMEEQNQSATLFRLSGRGGSGSRY